MYTSNSVNIIAKLLSLIFQTSNSCAYRGGSRGSIEDPCEAKLNYCHDEIQEMVCEITKMNPLLF